MNHIDQAKVDRFEFLKTLLNQHKKEYEALREEFLKTNGGESDKNMVFIKLTPSERVAGKDAFTEKLGANWLTENGLLNKGESREVVISPKGAK
jgi:hypothetical protein